MNAYLKDFGDYLRNIKQMSERTCEAYLEDINTFSAWYQISNGRIPEPSDLTSIDLREYQMYLHKNKSLMPATVNRRLIGVRSYLYWSLTEGHIQRLPTFPRPIRQQKHTPKSLERSEQNRLLREVERRGKVRDIAIIRLFLSCGLRVQELTTLELADLDLGERHGRLTIKTGKGKKYRQVPVPPETRKILREWLTERQTKFSGNPWLFPNRKGGHITTRLVQQMVKNIGYFAGLDIHPHIFRHTAASNMIHAGADLVTVARILGHESLNTTAIYTQPTEADMNKAMENAEI